LEEQAMSRKSVPASSTLMLIGVVLVIFGILLLLSPAAVGGAVVKLVALVLVVTGVVQLMHSLRSGTMANRTVSAVLGAIVAGVGVLVWFNPELGSGFLTALLMIFFVVNGLWKITYALRFRRFTGWAWLLASGLLSLVFVWLLWVEWPLSGAWAIGVLVGLDLLLAGIALILVSRAVRKMGTSQYLDTIQL
jgi:uncharacterized membrane protein HdeD (DUF308 family)